MSASTSISDYVKTCTDEELRYLFYERSGMCIHDGLTVQQADEESFKQTFGHDLEGMNKYEQRTK